MRKRSRVGPRRFASALVRKYGVAPNATVFPDPGTKLGAPARALLDSRSSGCSGVCPAQRSVSSAADPRIHSEGPPGRRRTRSGAGHICEDDPLLQGHHPEAFVPRSEAFPLLRTRGFTPRVRLDDGERGAERDTFANMIRSYKGITPKRLSRAAKRFLCCGPEDSLRGSAWTTENAERSGTHLRI